jgi:hypothetical protein
MLNKNDADLQKAIKQQILVGENIVWAIWTEFMINNLYYKICENKKIMKQQ